MHHPHFKTKFEDSFIMEQKQVLAKKFGITVTA
jgi:uncharacterized protein YfeS